MTASKQSGESLQDVCEALRSQAHDSKGENVSVQSVLDAFSGRIFGPLLLIPAMVVVIPVFGAIPGVPTTMGILVVIIAGQAVIGRKHPWVPRVITKREISKEKLIRGLDRFQPWAKRIDWFLRPRLRFLVTGKMQSVMALLCVLMACTMPPLELLPFAAALPGLGIFCLGLAMTAKDGLLGLLGILTTGGVLGLLVWWML